MGVQTVVNLIYDMAFASDERSEIEGVNYAFVLLAYFKVLKPRHP